MKLKAYRDKPPWEWPIDSGDKFLEVLLDSHAEESDRLLAAELAGDYTVVNDKLVEGLLTVLANDDEPDELRNNSAIALGPALEHSYCYGFDDIEDILITEQVYKKIQEVLHNLFMNTSIPNIVRRRILEASVRAPQPWHEDAVRDAYSKGEDDWRLTAVFCMSYIRGFDDWIIESLDSSDPYIKYHAVCAAGQWGLNSTWEHIEALIKSEETEKELLLAAIEASIEIRPQEALLILGHHLDSDDQEIVDTTYEAIAMAEGLLELEDDSWNNEDKDETIH